MKSLVVVGVCCSILLSIISIGIGEEINCESPAPHPLIGKKCCSLPKPDWSKYEDKCKLPPPCQIACIFNTSDAFNGIELNLPNVKTILTNVYKNADVVDANYKAYEECASLMKEKIEKFMAARGSRNHTRIESEYCTPTAKIYLGCAHTKLIKYCPEALFQKSDQCTYVQSFAQKCPTKFWRPHHRGGRPKNSTEPHISTN